MVHSKTETKIHPGNETIKMAGHHLQSKTMLSRNSFQHTIKQFFQNLTNKLLLTITIVQNVTT